MAPPSTRSAVANVTVENTDALHCVVCCLPLKPPIFLCDQGHFLCSLCHEELAELKRCDVCPGQITSGYRRCDAMEKLVESIRVPCPNATYGCDATPAYYEHRDHLEKCPHRPCNCPVESCGFAGSVSSLLGHFATAHEWPCTKLTHSVWEEMYLRDGSNVLDVIDGVGEKHVLVLVVSPVNLGRAIISVVTYVDNGAYPCCKLKLDFSRYKEGDRGSDLRLSNRRRITFTGLCDGLRDPDDCFHFVAPRSFYPDEKEAIEVSVCVKFG